MDKGTLKKTAKTVLLATLAVGGTVGLVMLGKKMKTIEVLKSTLYTPFEDMSKEAAIELMKSAIEGTTEVIDAQVLGDEIAIWFNR